MEEGAQKKRRQGRSGTAAAPLSACPGDSSFVGLSSSCLPSRVSLVCQSEESPSSSPFVTRASFLLPPVYPPPSTAALSSSSCRRQHALCQPSQSPWGGSTAPSSSGLSASPGESSSSSSSASPSDRIGTACGASSSSPSSFSLVSLWSPRRLDVFPHEGFSFCWRRRRRRKGLIGFSSSSSPSSFSRCPESSFFLFFSVFLLWSFYLFRVSARSTDSLLLLSLSPSLPPSAALAPPRSSGPRSVCDVSSPNRRSQQRDHASFSVGFFSPPGSRFFSPSAPSSFLIPSPLTSFPMASPSRRSSSPPPSFPPFSSSASAFLIPVSFQEMRTRQSGLSSLSALRNPPPAGCSPTPSSPRRPLRILPRSRLFASSSPASSSRLSSSSLFASLSSSSSSSLFPLFRVRSLPSSSPPASSSFFPRQILPLAPSSAPVSCTQHPGDLLGPPDSGDDRSGALYSSPCMVRRILRRPGTSVASFPKRSRTQVKKTSRFSFFTCLWGGQEKDDPSSLRTSWITGKLLGLLKHQTGSFFSLLSKLSLPPPPLPPLIPSLQASLIGTYLLNFFFFDGQLVSSLSFDMYREVKLLSRKLRRRQGRGEGGGSVLFGTMKDYLELFLRSSTSTFVHANLLHLIVNLKGISKIFPVAEKLCYNSFFGMYKDDKRSTPHDTGVFAECSRIIPSIPAAVCTPLKNMDARKTNAKVGRENASSSYFSLLSLLYRDGNLSPTGAEGPEARSDDGINRWCFWETPGKESSRIGGRGGEGYGCGRRGWLARLTVLLLFLAGNACGNMTSFLVRRWWAGVEETVNTFRHAESKRRRFWGGIVRDEEVLQDEPDLPGEDEKSRKNIKIWERQMRLEKMKKWASKEGVQKEGPEDGCEDLEDEETEEIDPETWCVRTLGCSGGLYSLLGLLVGSARVDRATKRDVIRQIGRRILTELLAPVGSSGLDEPGHMGGFLFGVLAAHLLGC